MIKILEQFKSRKGGHPGAQYPAISISRKGVISINQPALELMGVSIGKMINFAFDDESNTYFVTPNTTMHDGYMLRTSKASKNAQFYCKDLACQILKDYGLYTIDQSTFRRKIEAEAIDGIFYPIHKPGVR
jgi:hypothetical protein